LLLVADPAPPPDILPGTRLATATFWTGTWFNGTRATDPRH